MKLYQMQVTKTAIYRTAPAKIPRGIVGAVLQLRFSPEWEGLHKTAVFRAGDVTKDVLEVGDCVQIPAECTREAGAVLEVGIYGTDGENTVAIPTLWAQIGTVYEAADPSGDTSTDPVLPVWAQLQAQIDQLEEQGIRDKSIAEAVEDYMAANPVEPEDLGVAPAGLAVCRAEGAHITVTDCGALPLHSLKLYGRTVQPGTPSPDSPAELVSVGSGGSIQTTVAGKNLLGCVPVNITTNGVTITTGADGRYTLNGTATGVINPALCPYDPGTRTCIPAGTYTFSGHPGTANIAKLQIPVYPDNETTTFLEIISLTHSAPTRTVTFQAPVYLGAYLYADAGVTCSNAVYAPVIEIGAVKTEYEPYKGRTLTTSTPNGLPGIPVSSGGNYTDEAGQAWICDEIDFARGVYVQRIDKVAFQGAEIFQETTSNYIYTKANIQHPPKPSSAVISTHLPVAERINAASNLLLPKAVFNFNSMDDFKAYLSEQSDNGTPLTCLYELAAPIETALSGETLAAWACLYTNQPRTVIYNSAMAHMAVEYYTPISALPVAGGRMGGNIAMAGNRVTELGAPVGAADAVSLGYAEASFAPAGHGLGETADYIGSWNSGLNTGFYRSNGDAPDAYWWWGYVVAYSGESVVQHVYRNGTHGILSAHRSGGSGGFGEWEWDNPPMERGVEYRTTERYNGVAVYKKLVNCGYLPNNGMKQVTFSADTTVQAHKVYGKAGTMTLPYLTNARIGVTKNRIVITTDTDYSDRYGAVIVEYTKP